MQRLSSTRHRSFKGLKNGTEHFIAITSPASGGFPEQLDFVQTQYSRLQNELGLTRETAVFHRIFLSDAANQSSHVQASALNDSSIAVSIIQQPPLPQAKIAFLAYHVAEPAPLAKRRLSPGQLLVRKGDCRHLWTTQVCAGNTERTNSPEAQTAIVFKNLIDALAQQGGKLRDNCVRTWIYLRNVDVFYAGMVARRSTLFEEHDLTCATHTIASTGIEGSCAHNHDLVVMDAYSNLDLADGQMTYLNDFDRMCSTHQYNVTFERGAHIAYADWSHLFISGTASIDKNGAVVHPGDVLRQAEYAMENIAALLRSRSASLADMMYLIVYLRDPADFGVIDKYFHDHFPQLPLLIVQGAVCRPAWLIEAEGVAITHDDQPHWPTF